MMARAPLTPRRYFDIPRNMEMSVATAQLSALAQRGRLALFRRLVAAGQAGIAAGRLADELGVAPNTLSAQLAILCQAGLAASERCGRSILYRARLEAISDLILYLVEDCCAGRPEACLPVIDGLTRCLDPSCHQP